MLPDVLKKHGIRSRQAIFKMHSKVARVFYENPAHLLNSSSYAKKVSDFDLSSSIKNAFISAKLMNLKPKPRIRAKFM